MSGVCSISRHRLSATPANAGIAEGRGLALDVVSGAEQLVMGFFGEAEPLDVLPRGVEPLALGMHPVGEFVRQLRQRRFGARDRIVVAIGTCVTALRKSFGGVMTSWSAKVATEGVCLCGPCCRSLLTVN